MAPQSFLSRAEAINPKLPEKVWRYILDLRKENNLLEGVFCAGPLEHTKCMSMTGIDEIKAAVECGDVRRVPLTVSIGEQHLQPLSWALRPAFEPNPDFRCADGVN